MSLRPSRSLAMAFSLLIVVVMIVSAPVMALADSGNSQAPTEPPGNSASATSQSTTPPGPPEGAGNSASAPGQTGATAPATTSAPADPGNSGDAPGQNKTDTSTTQSPPPQSNAGGNSGSSGGGNKATTTGGGSTVPESHGKKDATGGDPAGKGDGPTTGAGGNNCDGDPSGGSNTGNGANTSGDFDNTCPSPSGPAPNGNGGGGAKGKPCAGCVGNADDKNPPGQSKGDNNSGYECEPDGGKGKGNKGVGGGNPAHTGCQPTITDSSGCTSWALTVEVTNGRTTHGSASYTSLPNNVTIVATANPNHTLTGQPNGGTTKSYTTTFSTTDCSESFSVTFNPMDRGCQVNCSPPPPPIVDCDGDGVDDNVDNNLKDCEPPPPGEDCDDDGVPDNLDTDLSECEPEVRPALCPDGSEMPESGICDEVLGEIIEKDPKPVFPGGPVVAGEILGAPEAQPQAAVLPFTGGNLLPFLIVSMSLMGVGGSVLRRRGKTRTEREAA